MDYEHEKKMLEKKLAAAQAKLEDATQRRKAARQRLKSEEVQAKAKAEKWHRFSLAHHLREAGYNGEHAIALMSLRSMPLEMYMKYVSPAVADPTEPIIASEYRFLQANLAALTEAGKKRLLKRDQENYNREKQGWENWQRTHPDQLSWRQLKPSKQQIELAMRIVEAKGLTAPTLTTRGEAHDWISAQGGNPRMER